MASFQFAIATVRLRRGRGTRKLMKNLAGRGKHFGFETLRRGRNSQASVGFSNTMSNTNTVTSSSNREFSCQCTVTTWQGSQCCGRTRVAVYSCTSKAPFSVVVRPGFRSGT
eukprot:935379-Rhodomonas_salina.2